MGLLIRPVCLPPTIPYLCICACSWVHNLPILIYRAVYLSRRSNCRTVNQQVYHIRLSNCLFNTSQPNRIAQCRGRLEHLCATVPMVRTLGGRSQWIMLDFQSSCSCFGHKSCKLSLSVCLPTSSPVQEQITGKHELLLSPFFNCGCFPSNPTVANPVCMFAQGRTMVNEQTTAFCGSLIWLDRGHLLGDL